MPPSKLRQTDGILNVNKPTGISSFDVIRRLRKLSGIKKMGHLGTLDPLASGVLPIFVGKYTKLIEIFAGLDKRYTATLELGVRTDTYDREGQVIEVRDWQHLQLEDLQRQVYALRGQQLQTPPLYSAVKIKGKPAYAYAREGKTAETKARTVQIHELTLCGVDLPRLKLQVYCSKGTYVRSLVDELGRRLDVGAHIVALERDTCGNCFTLENATALADLEQEYKETQTLKWFDPQIAFAETPRCLIDHADIPFLSHGRTVKCKEIFGNFTGIEKGYPENWSSVNAAAENNGAENLGVENEDTENEAADENAENFGIENEDTEYDSPGNHLKWWIAVDVEQRVIAMGMLKQVEHSFLFIPRKSLI